MDPDDIKIYLQHIRELAPNQQGLHIAGGEPFLNFELTLQAVELCVEYGIPLHYVETNAHWCDHDDIAFQLFHCLRDSGLPAILISASPFHNEFIPFEYTERAVRIGREVFGPYNVLVFTDFFFHQLLSFDKTKKLAFNRYINTVGQEKAAQSFINHYSLIPTGRVASRLNHLYQPKPANFFFNNHCYAEFTNPHHIHIDPEGNYIVSFCAGISPGKADHLDEIYRGIDLQDFPILELLVEQGVEGLFKLARDQFNYVEREAGYIAKCHLCQDIRQHIVSITDQFEELTPLGFYLNL